MANLFENLALPALNGAGAATDVSAMGPAKTVVVSGAFEGASITIEVSVDGGTSFAPVATFQSGSTRKELLVAATHIRVNVSGRSALVAFSANIDVGANDGGMQQEDLVIPAGNGAGTSVDVSALGTFNTVIVSGTFPKAAVLIEVSEDDVVWAPLCQFSGKGGLWSGNVTGNFMRARVKGRTSGSVFTGVTAAVGAANDAVTGGGGGEVFADLTIAGDGTAEDPLTTRSSRVFRLRDDFCNLKQVTTRVEATGAAALNTNSNGMIGRCRLNAPAIADSVAINLNDSTRTIATSQLGDVFDGFIEIGFVDPGFAPTALADYLLRFGLSTESGGAGGGLFGTGWMFGLSFATFNVGTWCVLIDDVTFFDTGVAVDGEPHIFRVEFGVEAGDSYAIFYIDGVEVGTIPSVGVYTPTTMAVAEIRNVSQAEGVDGSIDLIDCVISVDRAA